jgi:hypothetical protein
MRRGSFLVDALFEKAIVEDFEVTIFSSTKEFQELHEGHFPSHFGASWPHS